MPLLPSRSFTHRPRVPLALVPTVENPIGVNVNLLLPPERLALALSKMEECMVLSRSTVLTPFLVITAIQRLRSEEHTSELQSLMRISYAVFCLKKNTTTHSSKYTQH